MEEFFTPEQQVSDLNLIQNRMVEFCMLNTSNLETIVLRDGSIYFPLVESVGGRSRPAPFIAHSLRRIHTSRRGRNRPISARMIIWMILFCPLLYEASFNFTVSPEDLKFLELHQDAFKRKSNVKKLAIAPFLLVTHTNWSASNSGLRTNLNKVATLSSLITV